jgi:DNA polymerase-3 subunit epsilon
MKTLTEYIAFDLEFNTVKEKSHIIQVSAVKFKNNREVDYFDTYVYSDVPLQSFINGLTGITSEKITTAPKIEQVMSNFQAFIGQTPLIGYNALKSDLPLLLDNGLDVTNLYKLDVFDEAFERRSSDLNGVSNLQLHTVADYLGISGKSHDSLEDARMTALIYEKFMEFDDNSKLLNQQEETANNPFAGLDLSGFLD